MLHRASSSKQLAANLDFGSNTRELELEWLAFTIKCFRRDCYNFRPHRRELVTWFRVNAWGLEVKIIESDLYKLGCSKDSHTCTYVSACVCVFYSLYACLCIPLWLFIVCLYVCMHPFSTWVCIHVYKHEPMCISWYRHGIYLTSNGCRQPYPTQWEP